MDKNKIKSFAIWARRNLIAAVSEKANRIGITENSIEEAIVVQGGFQLKGKEEIFPLSKRDRDALVSQVKEKGFEQVMEEVAYTWFNRFMGIRYMEVNDYLPSGIRILSSEVEGKLEPDALTKVFSLIDDLNLDINKVEKLISDIDENGAIKTTTQKHIDTRELYKYLIIRQCNELGRIIPQMFEKISDYTELLLPDNLLEEGSVIRRMVSDIEESDWKEEVEIIGWMYQYYISEKKDEVFAALKKNVKITKENIPVATQLFTPKWIVKYMVENSLGRLWLEGHPNEELQKEWKYYLEEAEQEPEVEEELKKIREEHAKLKPEDIKVLDPCMGSGHILVYAFDVLYEIYKTAGYSEREIPRLILQNNLYGLDIDDRASQLASFALMMKARHYNRRLFREIEREHLELNLCSIQESNNIDKEAIDYFVNGNEELIKNIEYLVDVFNDAKEYGSILEVKKVNFESLKQRLREIEQEENFMFADYRKMILDKFPMMIKQAEIMSRKYEVCVTNPPYMGNNGMGSKLNGFLKKHFSDSKSDLFAAYIEKLKIYCKTKGFYTLITQPSWLFLGTFTKLRENITNNSSIINLLQMGRGIFGIDFGSTAFVLRNNQVENYYGDYYKLYSRIFQYIDLNDIEKLFLNAKTNKEFKYDFSTYKNSDNGIIGERKEELKIKDSEQRKDEMNIRYIYNQKNFKVIPGNLFSYWAGEKIIDCINNCPSVKKYGEGRIGMATADNDRFLKMWYEVKTNKISFASKNRESAMYSNKKWFPYIKGGGFKKWYGFYEFVVNWENDGYEIRNFKDEKTGRIRSHNYNLDYIFKKGLSWSSLGSNSFSIRIIENSIFGSGGSTLLSIDDNNIDYLLGLLNSKVSNKILSIFSSTLNFEVSMIEKLPVVIDNNNFGKVKAIVNQNIQLAKDDWDSFETSWDFKVHPLLNLVDRGEQYSLISIFKIWETECEDAFEQLKYNEEELNRIFIDIYGLQDELTPEVDDKDITIRKADRERDIKSFISYAVGCILGRYSIDVEGLIYAGGEFKEKWNFDEKKVRNIEKDEDGNIISDSWISSTFIPDVDNIIPITEDEYFEDDIVLRFIDFVRTVYGNDTLEENLDFIADSIGRKSSETARQAIRRYFIKDFYKDHLKVYQKRPIYWMFESGKNDGFKCLVYMHRYNEQTIAKIRTDYLHTLQRKYEAEINRLQLVVDSEEYTAKDRTAAKKKIDRISKQIEECIEYDQVVAYLANEKISIDLDDGVKVNYAKFQDIKVINSKGKEVKMNLLAKV